MTWPLPSANLKVSPRSQEESNCSPSTRRGRRSGPRRRARERPSSRRRPRGPRPRGGRRAWSPAGNVDVRQVSPLSIPTATRSERRAEVAQPRPAVSRRRHDIVGGGVTQRLPHLRHRPPYGRSMASTRSRAARRGPPPERGAAGVEQVGLVLLLAHGDGRHRAAHGGGPGGERSLASQIAFKQRCAVRFPDPCWQDPLTEAYGRGLAGAIRALAPAPAAVAGLAPVDYRRCGR